jgi:hypothetical protein
MWKFIFITSLPQAVEHNVTVKNLCKFVHCIQGLGSVGVTLKTETLLTYTPVYSAP